VLASVVGDVGNSLLKACHPFFLPSHARHVLLTLSSKCGPHIMGLSIKLVMDVLHLDIEVSSLYLSSFFIANDGLIYPCREIMYALVDGLSSDPMLVPRHW
jgi:hypothetical protein